MRIQLQMLESLLWDTHLYIHLTVVTVQYYQERLLLVLTNIRILLVLVEALGLRICQVVHITHGDGLLAACNTQ